MIKLGKKEKSLLENSCKNIYEEDEKGRTVLHYAVDAKTVRLLVEKGANVNAADVEGYTALHLAITEKRLETVRELIKSGADVNAEEYRNKCYLSEESHLSPLDFETGLVTFTTSGFSLTWCLSYTLLCK